MNPRQIIVKTVLRGWRETVTKLIRHFKSFFFCLIDDLVYMKGARTWVQARCE